MVGTGTSGLTFPLIRATIASTVQRLRYKGVETIAYCIIMTVWNAPPTSVAETFPQGIVFVAVIVTFAAKLSHIFYFDVFHRFFPSFYLSTWTIAIQSSGGIILYCIISFNQMRTISGESNNSIDEILHFDQRWLEMESSDAGPELIQKERRYVVFQLLQRPSRVYSLNDNFYKTSSERHGLSPSVWSYRRRWTPQGRRRRSQLPAAHRSISRWTHKRYRD